MTVEIISWSISTTVWDRAGIELATPGSAVRHASVARHVTDCATRPGLYTCSKLSTNEFLLSSACYPATIFWSWKMYSAFYICCIQSTLFILTLFITATLLTMSVIFAQMYQFTVNLISLQQKFSLLANFWGTNTVIVIGLTVYSKAFQTTLDHRCKHYEPWSDCPRLFAI